MIEPVSVDRVLVLVPNDQAEAAIPEPGSSHIEIEELFGRLADLAPLVHATWALIAEEVAVAARAWTEALRNVEGLPEVPPTDPRARALWLRQRRNTGPVRQRRAPRSLAPGRSR